MNSTTNWISWLIVLMGVGISLWSWQIWRDPSALNPGSVMYRFFYVRWRAWHQGERKNNKKRLTDAQIKHYAIRGIVIGIVLVVIGFVMVWRKWRGVL